MESPVIRRLLNAVLGSPDANGPSKSLAHVNTENVTRGVIPLRPEQPLHAGHPVPTYPDKGVAAPAVTPALLIESQRKQIDALHQVSSFSREDFDAYIMPSIERYAAYVHLLPASESQHHCGQGGLFRHGLEVAFNAALACEGKVFAFDHWASERDKLVPRWRMCAILGGMVHDMGKPIIDVGAIDGTGNLIWNPHACSLYDWLQENRLSEYYIHWRPGARHKRHEAFNAVALYRIVPDVTLRWLTAHGGQEPLDNLIMALSGISNPANPLAALIKQADSKSVSKDIQESRTRMAASGLGGSNSLAVRLNRAMHDLIQDGAWEVNKVGSPVWVTTEGVFGLYPAVIKGAVDVLRDQGDTSLPNDYSNVLDVLASWGYLHPNILPNGQQFHTWRVRIFATDRGKPMEMDTHVVRFSKEDLLPRALIPPEPVKVVVLGMDGKPITAGGVLPGSQNEPEPADSRERAHVATPTPAPELPESEEQGEAASRAPLEYTEEPADASTMLLSDDPAEGVLLASGTGTGSEQVDLLTLDGEAPEGNRDRANELDPREEMIIRARQQMSKRWPPESPEAAAAFFRDQGAEGQLVITLANRVTAGKLKEGEQLWDVHDKIHFRYPEAFEDLGIAETDIRKMLEDKGWTEREAHAQTRSTVMLNIGGAKKVVTLRFNDNISPAIQMLLPARSGAAAGGTTAVCKRVLPLGPFIDADVAGLIKDMVSPHQDDSALIRPGFHQFAMQELEQTGSSLEAMTGSDLMSLARSFVKKHGLTSTKWLAFHLTHGENPWGVIAHSAKNDHITYNHDYQIEHDLAEQAKRGIA